MGPGSQPYTCAWQRPGHLQGTAAGSEGPGPQAGCTLHGHIIAHKVTEARRVLRQRRGCVRGGQGTGRTHIHTAQDTSPRAHPALPSSARGQASGVGCTGLDAPEPARPLRAHRLELLEGQTRRGRLWAEGTSESRSTCRGFPGHWLWTGASVGGWGHLKRGSGSSASAGHQAAGGEEEGQARRPQTARQASLPAKAAPGPSVWLCAPTPP